MAGPRTAVNDVRNRIDERPETGAKTMKNPNRTKPAPRLNALPVAMVTATALLALMAPELAGASTDTTFQGPLDTIEGIVGGTGGQLAAALAVGAALVGSVLRFNAMQLMGAVGVGVAAGAGVGIVTGLVGTSIV